MTASGPEPRSGADLAHHRAIVDGWIGIQTVFSSRAVADWYHDRVDVPVTDVDARRVLFQVATDGPTRVTDVATELGTSISSASRVVQRLVADGLVRRAVSPTDRRATSLEVTDAGRAAFRAFCEADLCRIRKHLAAFSVDELATFADLITRFANEVASWHDELTCHQPTTGPVEELNRGGVPIEV